MPRKLFGVIFSALVAFVIFGGIVVVGHIMNLPSEIRSLEQGTASTATVKLFFANSVQDPNVEDCSKTYAVSRTVPKNADVIRAALNQLLAGPTDVEKTAGFYTAINDGVKINYLTVADGVARVDFDYQLERQVGGSCRVTMIRSQIVDTVRQFPGVSEVVVSVEGRVREALQP